MQVAAFGFLELLLVLLSGGSLAGGGLFGMPPGEIDAALLRAPHADVFLFQAWADRAPGKEGGSGIDGLAADPEILAFLENVERAIVTASEQGTAGGTPEEQALAKHLPPLIKRLLNRSGCFYLHFDADAAAKIRGEGLPPGVAASLQSGLRATLIISGGDEADTIAEHLTAVVGLLPGQPAEGTLDRRELPSPVPGATLTLHRHANYFVLGLGEGTIDSAIAGLDGKREGLSAGERFAAARKRVAIERTAGMMWLDLEKGLEQAAATLGDQGPLVTGTAQLLGLDAVRSVATTVGVVDGQIRTKRWIATNGKTEGLLAVAAGRSLKPADFALVPADADVVIGWSLNLQKLLGEAKEIVGKADRNSLENFEAILAQLERELGVSFEDDLFPAFGDAWVVHNAPSSGGVFLTGAVASLEVRDPQKAYVVFSQLMKVLKQAMPGEYGGDFRRRAVYLAETKFMDRTIYYINTIGDDVPFAPAFCVTEKHLLAAPHPQALKSHLRFMKSKEATFAERLEKELQLPKADLLCASYYQTRDLVEQVYAFAPYFARLMFSELQRERIELDIFSLPSARAILPYTSNAFATITRHDDGLVFDTQSGLPVPGGIGSWLNVPLMGASRVLFMVRRALPVGGAVPANGFAPARAAEVRIEVRPAAPQVRPANARPLVPQNAP